MRNKELTKILSEWKKEAEVKSPISYKTNCSRDNNGKDILDIFTEQPRRMENYLGKYKTVIYNSGLLKEKLDIHIYKVDSCVY